MLTSLWTGSGARAPFQQSATLRWPTCSSASGSEKRTAGGTRRPSHFVSPAESGGQCEFRVGAFGQRGISSVLTRHVHHVGGRCCPWAPSSHAPGLHPTRLWVPRLPELHRPWAGTSDATGRSRWPAAPCGGPAHPLPWGRHARPAADS